MLKEIFESIRTETPVVHSTASNVMVSGCAGIPLACSASWIMSEDMPAAAAADHPTDLGPGNARAAIISDVCAAAGIESSARCMCRICGLMVNVQ